MAVQRQQASIVCIICFWHLVKQNVGIMWWSHFSRSRGTSTCELTVSWFDLQMASRECLHNWGAADPRVVGLHARRCAPRWGGLRAPDPWKAMDGKSISIDMQGEKWKEGRMGAMEQRMNGGGAPEPWAEAPDGPTTHWKGSLLQIQAACERYTADPPSMSRHGRRERAATFPTAWSPCPRATGSGSWAGRREGEGGVVEVRRATRALLLRCGSRAEVPPHAGFLPSARGVHLDLRLWGGRECVQEAGGGRENGQGARVCGWLVLLSFRVYRY
jgi:hypothetical protein